MRLTQHLKNLYETVHESRKLGYFLFAVFLLSLLYPSDLTRYPKEVDRSNAGFLVYETENYLRFINTAVQIIVPVILADKAGMVQLAYIAVSTTIATDGVKRLVNDWNILGTRLGQRPSYEGSKHNAPSGHSSMASCAAYFVCRRYSRWYALLLVPILLLTMYARVMLNDHTISAVLSGAFLGLLTAAIFTTKLRDKAHFVIHKSPNQ